MRQISKTGIFLLTLLLISFPLLAESEEEKDFAVPAFSDFQALGSGAQKINSNIIDYPVIPQIRWLDLNQDQKLSDFDINQFESIIENLRGEELSGLQLILRFRAEQKNQKDSFPLLYDLDRDGMFTGFDVDAFSEVINRLDEGATRGNELVEKFKLQLVPQEKY